MKRTELWKFSKRSLRKMVIRKWLNMKNSNNLSSITSIIISPHHKKLVKTDVKIIRRRARKKILWDLLCHETIITEGRDNNSWNIDCCRKEIHLRNLENPSDKQGTRVKKSPAENRQTSRNNIKTSDKSGDPPKKSGGETRAARSKKRLLRNLQ